MALKTGGIIPLTIDSILSFRYIGSDDQLLMMVSIALNILAGSALWSPVVTDGFADCACWGDHAFSGFCNMLSLQYFTILTLRAVNPQVSSASYFAFRSPPIAFGGLCLW